MKIAVLLGGISSERDVSIASGLHVCQALRQGGHEVVTVDTARGVLSDAEEKQLMGKIIGPAPPDDEQLSGLQSGLDLLAMLTEISEIDVVFIALHGGTGEDGSVQSILEQANITFTGSGPKACINAMDKQVAKQLFRDNDILTPDWLMAPVTIAAVAQQLTYPVVVKPDKQGSSVGLTVVHDENELIPAIDMAYQHDSKVMIEQFIHGQELTVGILDNLPLEVGEIIPRCSDIFDYESKYQKGGADEIFPAEISEQLALDAKALALRAHQALQLRGFSRVDFRLDRNNKLWCLEANTVPGLTPLSLLPKSAAAANINFTELCDRICQLALARKRTG